MNIPFVPPLPWPKKKAGLNDRMEDGENGGKLVKVWAFSEWVIGVVGACCVVKMLKGDELLMGKCFWRLHMTDRHGGRRIIKHKDSRTNTHLQNNIHVRPIRDLHSSTQQNRSKILSGHPPEAVLPVESEQTSRWTSASITVYNPLHISIHNSNIVYTVYAYCTYVSVLILTPFMPRNTGTNCPFQKETHLFLPSVSGSMFPGRVYTTWMVVSNRIFYSHPYYFGKMIQFWLHHIFPNGLVQNHQPDSTLR